MDFAIFTHLGGPKNYIDVCLNSLRRCNKECKIFFFYSNYFLKLYYQKYDIEFIKIDKNICSNYRKINYYGLLMLRNVLKTLNKNDQILMLDVDLLFQKDPFKMFSEKPNNDLYYTYCIMSKPESLRPEKIWKSVKWKINAGVWGIRINNTTNELLEFWIKNIEEESYQDWINFELRLSHLINGKSDIWWCDQDFLNFIDNYKLPLTRDLKKVDIGYEYNYFTSTWGYFNEELTMGNKIGDENIAVIHFKSNFKELYNLNNPRIYNIENIISRKQLTTKRSRKIIYNKFIKRGEKRFEMV